MGLGMTEEQKRGGYVSDEYTLMKKVSKHWNIGIVSEDLSLRHQKALQILEDPEAMEKVSHGVYAVKSQTGFGVYLVRLKEQWTCNCPDWKENRGHCKHILAVRYTLELEDDIRNEIDYEVPKRSYPQSWSLYNMAQMNEGEKFEELLRELCNMIPEPEQHMGRPRIPLSDQVYCAVLKIYEQKSSRRAHTKLRRAEYLGKIARAPHFNQISTTLLKEELTPILEELIRASAGPLAGLESRVAIDSSGFRCSTFGAYCDIKHGTKRKHNWVKAHICVGVKTNVVTDVVVTDGHAADSPQFKTLIDNTAKRFKIAEASADKAYLSRENLEVVGDLGGTPYIPFKSNTKRRALGSPMWKKMYHYFQIHREDFDKHYHVRSNVETTFGAIKDKFGESIRSKNPVAQRNELLCKILAYNITVLIHEMYLNGIEPGFIN